MQDKHTSEHIAVATLQAADLPNDFLFKCVEHVCAFPRGFFCHALTLTVFLRPRRQYTRSYARKQCFIFNSNHSGAA